jgi:hypothetical protein
MAGRNPTDPVVEITLGEKTYKLLFNFEAIASAEDVTGFSLISGLRSKDVDAPKISLVRALFWAQLRAYHPDLTYEAAAMLVTQWTWRSVWEKVIEAWVAGMKRVDPASDPTEGRS